MSFEASLAVLLDSLADTALSASVARHGAIFVITFVDLQRLKMIQMKVEAMEEALKTIDQQLIEEEQRLHALAAVLLFVDSF